MKHVNLRSELAFKKARRRLLLNLAQYLSLGEPADRGLQEWLRGRGNMLIEGILVSRDGSEALKKWVHQDDANRLGCFRSDINHKYLDRLIQSWANSKLEGIYSPVAYHKPPTTEAALVWLLCAHAEALGNKPLAERMQTQTARRVIVLFKLATEAKR